MKFIKKIFKKIIILVILFIGVLYKHGVDAQALKYSINFIGSFENSKYNKVHNATGSISIDFELPFNYMTVYNIGGINYDYSINFTNINSSDYSHSVLKGPSLDIYEEDYIGQFSVPLGIRDNVTTPTTFYGNGRCNMTDNSFDDSKSIQVANVINNILSDSKSYKSELFNVILYLKSENITPMAIATLKYNNLTISIDTSSEGSTDFSHSNESGSTTSIDSKESNSTPSSNETTPNNPPVSETPSPTSSPSSSLNPGGLENSDSSKSSNDSYPIITFITILIITLILLL